MPTANPRITITLRPELHAVLRKLSELTGNSQSAFVSELLEASMPIFERMAQTLAKVEELRALGLEMPREVQGSLREAQSRIEQQLDLLMDDAPPLAAETLGWADRQLRDREYRSLLDEAEGISRRGRSGGVPKGGHRAPAKAVPTPMSNRGVTPTPKGQGQASKRTGKGGR